MYDVIIVGLGPAGATAARLLSQNVKALAIDRVAEKPCGGLLSPDAQKEMARFDLTLPKEILVDPQIFAVRTIDLDNGLTRRYQRMYINMDRARFDEWLKELIPPHIQRCTGRVTEIKRDTDGYSLTVACADGTVRTEKTKRIIAADGGGSFVRRTLCPNNKVKEYIAVQQRFPEENKTPFYSCVFDSETSRHCSWSLSKNDCFIFGGTFDKKGSKEAFEKQREKVRAQGIVFGNVLRTEACVVLRPSSMKDFVCAEGEVYFIGEAAGFISPSSFEGLSYAMKSARLLAELINNGSLTPRSYRRAVLGLRLKLLSKRLKCPFMYQPWLRNLVLRSGINTVK